MAIKIMVKPGDSVPMSECDDFFWAISNTTGKVKRIDHSDNLVVVEMCNGYCVSFPLDGDSWSYCGNYKRDIPFVS